jgi:hypothetical protein
VRHYQVGQDTILPHECLIVKAVSLENNLTQKAFGLFRLSAWH